MQQVLGEYSERLESAGLTPIVSCPEEPVMILADGRHMWRILDNLMNNICKYAQQGTRVYLSLEKDKGNALMTFRNISREELNISAEELTERFTRGDSSRNTEGNGLGLAIADSLTKLQGGQMKLTLDGDLFKVQLQFPLRA
jgi:signal transduction histidine kinase